MITINAAFGQEEKVLGTLGRIGENETRQIVFDCSDILTEYPGAEIVCVMQRHCDRIAYLADAVLDGNALTVTLTDADVSAPGDLRIELRALTDGKIRKSAVYMGQVVSALRGEQDRPGNPTADVLNRIYMTISRAEKSIAEADAAAKSAQTVADTVQQKLDNGDFVGPAGKDGKEGEPGPKGDTGATGPQGPKGDTYDDREVRADISELKDDLTAITPDDTTVNGKPWTSKKTVDSMCMPIEATGNPVQVYPVEGYPLGVKVSWEPTQEGEGDPSPDNIRPITGRDAVSVTRCEKNLLNISQLKPEGYNLAGINILKPNTTYTFKPVSCGGIAFAFFLADSIVPNQATKQLDLTRAYINEGESTTFTTPSNTDSYSIMWLAGVKKGIHQIYPNVQFMLVAGNTAPTTYTPYIGQTNTITLPETVYGGTLDVETGVVTVGYGRIASYAGESLPRDWISDRDVYAPDATPTTGAQVAYKLDEPLTIQLTPQQIAALSGVNTLYTDAGTLTVTGREDPRHTIVELKNAIISFGGNI